MNTPPLWQKVLKSEASRSPFLYWLATVFAIGSVVSYLIANHDIFTITLLIVAPILVYLFYAFITYREMRHKERLNTVKFFLEHGNEWEMMVILNELSQRELRCVIKECTNLFDVSITKHWGAVGHLLLKHWPLSITKTPGGNTELHVAAAFGNPKQFRNALGHCDVTATNATGQTALDVAWIFNQKILAKTIAAHLERIDRIKIDRL